MTSRIISRCLLGLLMGGAIACERKGPPPADSPQSASANRWSELEQHRTIDIAALNAAEPDDPNELRTRVYRVTGSSAVSLLHESFQSADPPADPFQPAADNRSSGPPDPERVTNPVLYALKTYGIEFPPGAGANYTQQSGELIVTNNAPGFELLEALLNTFHDSSPTLINLRIEVFQLPAPLILGLSESAARSTDHRPEWQAVSKLVDGGDASLVDAISIATRSGQRAKVTAVEEHIHVGTFKWNETRKSMTPMLETREVGTTLETDCIIGADNSTLSINMAFEHHSAPPTQGHLEARVPESDDFIKIPTPVFHAHRLTTNVEMTTGTVLLIGTWRPSGRPEFERNDLMHVAFLNGEIQTIGGVERIR